MPFLSDAFLYLKALHIIAVIAWMAAMLYLPRLFVYHVEASPGGELDESLKVMERRLARIIMTPAMLAALLFGVLLIVADPGLLKQGWLHGKLLLLFVLFGLHGYFLRLMKAFARGERPHRAKFFRILNEAPTLLMIGIVFLAVLRPF